jgi:dynactin complex subunit
MASHGVNKLKRVIWRLKEEYPNKEFYLKEDIRRTIIMECGIDERTIATNIKALKELGWLKCQRKRFFIVEGKDYD